jgi:GGDEF domain-containing protein
MFADPYLRLREACVVRRVAPVRNEERVDMVNTLVEENAAQGVTTPQAVHHQYAALFDRATLLPGWPLLIDRTRMALERAARSGLCVAVIVLEDVRRRSSASPDFTTFIASLRDGVFADDTVARIEGRTFVIVLNDVADPDVIAETAAKIVEDLDIVCHVGAASGVLPCDPEELINQAREDAIPPPPPRVATWEDQYRSWT